MAKDYIEARDKIAELGESIQLFGDRATREEMAISDDFKKRIGQLEEELQSARNRISETKERMQAPLIKEKQEVGVYILKAEGILKHLSLQETIEKASLIEPRPEFYHTEIEAEGDYCKDEYTYIRYFIVKNDKPKNCYTLLIAGKSRLQVLLEKKGLYDYGLPAAKGHFPVWLKVKDLPSVEELIAYMNKRSKRRTDPLQRYFQTRDAYINTIKNYSLKDFEDLKVIREVPESEAPVIFAVKCHERSSTYRICKDFLYASVEGKAENLDALHYLRIGNKLYLRGGKAESYTIRETGNITFGDWWSLSFEAGGSGRPFNKASWEKALAEAENRITKKRGSSSEVAFNPPIITWVHPELIPILS